MEFRLAFPARGSFPTFHHFQFYAINHDGAAILQGSNMLLDLLFAKQLFSGFPS
jgi:hypothetical protein